MLRIPTATQAALAAAVLPLHAARNENRDVSSCQGGAVAVVSIFSWHQRSSQLSARCQLSVPAVGPVLRKQRRLEQGYNSLEQQMSRSNFSQLYLSIKTLLCCTLANRVRIAWIAWICAAATAGTITSAGPLSHAFIAPVRLVLRPVDHKVVCVQSVHQDVWPQQI